MEISQWIAGSLLLLFGGYVAVMNWVILVHTTMTKGSTSFAPLFGGVVLVAGMALLPVEGLRAWCWTGLFIDFGCAPLFLWMGVTVLTGKHKQADPDEDQRSSS